MKLKIPEFLKQIVLEIRRKQNRLYFFTDELCMDIKKGEESNEAQNIDRNS